MLIERDVMIDCLPLATYAGDTDLKIELARRTKFDYVDDCLAFYWRSSSSKWVGTKMFKEIKRVIEHQQELFDQYPDIRRSVFAEWYGKQGTAYLDERHWSPKATLCFAKSAYYSKQRRLEKSTRALASVFGKPGLSTAGRLYDSISG